MDFESLVNFFGGNATKSINNRRKENCYENVQDQFKEVTEEFTDLKLANQKYFKLSKDHEEMKLHLENKLKLQENNHHKIYNEFIKISSNLESLCQMDTESHLRAENLLKSTNIDYLQKQIHDSSLQLKYEKLEKQFKLKSRECDEALRKSITLESMLLAQAKNEKVLKNNFESKCIALEKYKKYVEYLLTRNNSFQTSVNDIENNMLVNINEEFDSMKSELATEMEHEKTFLEGKVNVECKYNELKEKPSNFVKEIALINEISGDLASVINLLAIEIKDADHTKKTLKSRLNKAEHNVLMTNNMVEHFELDLYSAQREYKNACTKIKCIENELNGLQSKSNDTTNKNNLESCDIINQLFDLLVGNIQNIKLKLSEFASAIISENRIEKPLGINIMSVEDDMLPVGEVSKGYCDYRLVSPNIEIDLEIDDNLEDKIDLINTLPKPKYYVENNVDELHNQARKLSNENSKLVNYMVLMKNDLKEKDSLVSKLNSELSEVRKQYVTFEEHNQALKEQVQLRFDIESELKNAKKSLIYEISILEPEKITDIVPQLNLSNLIDIFVRLKMKKEVETDLVNDFTINKQQYEDHLKQFQEKIKKRKEWQEQGKCDNL